MGGVCDHAVPTAPRLGRFWGLGPQPGSDWSFLLFYSPGVVHEAQTAPRGPLSPLQPRLACPDTRPVGTGQGPQSFLWARPRGPLWTEPL